MNGTYRVNMNEPTQSIGALIESSQKLIEIFGYWPSFHDAEVIDLHLWRGDVEPEAGRYVFPVLTVKLHVWEITSEVNKEGFFVSRCHTLSTLQFHNVDEFRMEGFNHQNAILGLSIVKQERAQGPSPVFAVQFDAAFGMGASFFCSRIEVVDAIPCSPDGIPVETR
jgi:hypothetical protein